VTPSASANLVATHAGLGATLAEHRPWRHRFALLHVASTWLLLVAGAAVTSHDAGLAVPDWPTSFGWLNPFAVPMIGNVFYEHGHREIAEAVGLLTVIEAVWLWRTSERGVLRRLAVWLVVLVLAQGGLGGLTVLNFLPPAVSIAHGMLAQSFFCLSICTAYVLSREWSRTVRRTGTAARALKRVALLAAGSLYVQLLLGAIVRHCWKKEMPPEAFPNGFADVLPPFAGPPVNGALARAILIHGSFAALVALALVGAAVHLRRNHRHEPRLTRLSTALVSLLAVQLALGVLTFTTRTNANVTTSHVVAGATLLGVAVWLVLRAFREPCDGSAGAPRPAGSATR